MDEGVMMGRMYHYDSDDAEAPARPAGNRAFLESVDPTYREMVGLLIRNMDQLVDKCITSDPEQLRRICLIAEETGFELVLPYGEEFDVLRRKTEKKAADALARNKEVLVSSLLADIREDEDCQQNLERVRAIARFADISDRFEALKRICEESIWMLGSPAFNAILNIAEGQKQEHVMRWVADMLAEDNRCYDKNEQQIGRIVRDMGFIKALADSYFTGQKFRFHTDLLQDSVKTKYGEIDLSSIAHLLECIARIRSESDSFWPRFEALFGKKNFIGECRGTCKDLKRIADALNAIIVLTEGKSANTCIRLFVRFGGDLSETNPARPSLLRPDMLREFITDMEMIRKIERLWADEFGKSTLNVRKDSVPAVFDEREFRIRIMPPANPPNRGAYQIARRQISS